MTSSVVINLLDRGNDLTSFFWPSVFFLKESILKFHQLPLWQPMFFSGMPLIGDPQNLTLYLPNILFLFLPINTAFFVLLFGHFVFAAISTYFLVRLGFKKSCPAGLIAAFAFVFSPKIFSHLEAGHYTMIVAFSWLPLFFLSFLKFIKKPNFKKASFLALILTIIFINYVNIFYFAFLFFVLFLLFENPKALKFLPLIVLIFLGLSSFQLLPQLELNRFSNRSQLTFADVAQPLFSFRLFLQSLFFPYFYGLENFRMENLLFPGLFVGLLAIPGFFRLRKKQRLIFVLWIIFSLLYSLGARIPFFIFFYKYFPFIKFMRTTTRLWIISNLLLAILAGMGAEWLAARFKWKRKSIWLLGGLLLAELLFVGVLILTRKLPESGIKNSSEIYQFLKKDSERFRIYCTTGCLSIKEAVKIGKPVLGGNNPVQLKDYVNFVSRAAGYQYDKYIPILPPYEVFPQKPQPDAELLGLLNTKYVLSPYPLEDKGLLLKEKMDEILIYENEKVLGQAFLEKETEKTPLKINYYSPNRITVKLEPEFEGQLVLSEIFYPGWQAEIDNRKVEIKKAHEVLRSIEVPKESREAVFLYHPKSFFLGIGISLLTLAIIVIIELKGKL